MSYNRARFIILENRAAIRDAEAARFIYDGIFEPLGGKYGGWISHAHDGPRPAHFYMFDDPSPVILAELIRIIRDGSEPYGIPGKLLRARWSENEVVYDIGQIMSDITSAMKTNMLTPPVEASDFARCWEGIKVLESIALIER